MEWLSTVTYIFATSCRHGPYTSTVKFPTKEEGPNLCNADKPSLRPSNPQTVEGWL
jgi:hypothetical protein